MLLNHIPIAILKGKTVTFKGRVKTENITDGYAGLWGGTDQPYGPLDFEGWDEKGISSTNDWQPFSVEVKIDSIAKSFDFGAINNGKGTAWFDNFEIYINGVKYIDNKPNQHEPTKKELTWLKKHIHPLKTCDPNEKSNEDLDVLMQLIGNSKVVALGETTHGSSEIFQMKDRIIRYLAEKNNFDIFSIEANMPEAYKLNEYIVEGKGDPKELIDGMYFWTWNTQEMLDLINWMKDFNSHKKKIQYTGFDMQFYLGSIICLESVLSDNNSMMKLLIPMRTILSENIDKIRKTGRMGMDPDKKGEIIDLIDKSRIIINKSDKTHDEKEWLEQNIRIIEQSLELTPESRDKDMADNFLWIKTHNPDSKFIIWAHNQHITKSGETMGAYLNKKLGNDYLTIGFAVFEGDYTAVGKDGLKSYPAQTAYPGTLEYYFNKIEVPIFILDLREAKKDKSKEAKWINSMREFRFVGAGKNDQEFYDTNITNDFDLLIFINETTSSKLLRNY